MRTLVIHIGYPKTATTTIQDSFFKCLHEMGEINYLGKCRLDESDSLSSVWNPWAPFVRYCVYNEPLVNSTLQDLAQKLQDGVNVLSNEDFPISFYNIDNRKFLPDIDPFIVPERISLLADSLGISDIKIVAVIRNQADAIYSSYVEGWRWHFRHEPSLDSLDKYLNQGFNKRINGVFRMFFYYEVLSRYRQVFGGENIHVCLFEDLKGDLNAFCSRFLASIAPNRADLLAEVLTSTQSNIKRKTETGDYLTDDVTWDEDIYHLYNRVVPRVLRERLRKSYLRKFAKKTLRRLKKRSGLRVERFSDDVKNEVKSIFCESNDKLAEWIGLREKMKKYGYFP